MKRQARKLKPRMAVIIRRVQPKDIEDDEAEAGGVNCSGSTTKGRCFRIGGGGGRSKSSFMAKAKKGLDGH